MKPSDNFHRITCNVGQCQMFYAGCLHRLGSIEKRTDRGLWPECVSAQKAGRCLAADMKREEQDGICRPYYLDRDDAGPGIVRRSEMGQPPRTPFEIAVHHSILASRDLKPYEPLPMSDRAAQALARRSEARPAEQSSVRSAGARGQTPPIAASSPSAFDLGSLITQEVSNLKAA